MMHVEYLVEWVGYPEHPQWTWEPADHLENTLEKIKEFETRS